MSTATHQSPQSPAPTAALSPQERMRMMAKSGRVVTSGGVMPAESVQQPIPVVDHQASAHVASLEAVEEFLNQAAPTPVRQAPPRPGVFTQQRASSAAPLSTSNVAASPSSLESVLGFCTGN